MCIDATCGKYTRAYILYVYVYYCYYTPVVNLAPKAAPHDKSPEVIPLRKRYRRGRERDRGAPDAIAGRAEVEPQVPKRRRSRRRHPSIRPLFLTRLLARGSADIPSRYRNAINPPRRDERRRRQALGNGKYINTMCVAAIYYTRARVYA